MPRGVGSPVRGALLGAAGLVLGAVGAVTYAMAQVQRPARGSPEEFLSHDRPAGRRVVVCLGASIVHGRVSVDFVELLRHRLPAGDYVFVNAGRNGDLAYNVLQRLDPVVACDPDAIVILVGTNDVQGTLSERIRRLATRGNRLPEAPSLAWYRRNMDEIVAELHRRTRARVGLCSLPVLGEDLASLANRRVAEFNATIRQVAEERGAAYLPVHEREVDYLTSIGRVAGPGYTDSFLPVMGAAVGHFALRQSLDAISRRNGLALTTDRIHLNGLGARIVAEEIERFLLSG